MEPERGYGGTVSGTVVLQNPGTGTADKVERQLRWNGIGTVGSQNPGTGTAVPVPLGSGSTTDMPT